MTDTVLFSLVKKFTKEQLEAVDSVLRILDPDEYRDYHDQFGVCNAPDRIDLLRKEVQNALEKL
ncbi:MAG: hypothetical protein ACFFBJ_02565 [Promethearchaeota archaeon]